MADQAIYSPMRVLDADGLPVAGAICTFYASGTITLINIFSDADGSILAVNPAVADADGFLPQRFVSEPAKVVVTTSGGDTIRTIDPVPTAIGSTSGASQVSFVPSGSIPFSNVQAAIDGIYADLNGQITTIEDGLGDLSGEDSVTTALFDATTLEVAADGISDDDEKIATSSAVYRGRGPTFRTVKTTAGAAPWAFSVPSWATEIIITSVGTSLSGTDDFLVQLSADASYVTSGYTSYTTKSGNQATSTSGFIIYGRSSDAIFTGEVRLIRHTGNTWLCTHVGYGDTGDDSSVVGSGFVTLGGALDGVRLNVSGSNTADAISINVSFR